MSYEIYSYRPVSDKPDVQEAEERLDGRIPLADDASALKERIAEALCAHNPRLERFEFDHEEIARMQGITLEEAQDAWDHIELTPPDGDDAIQFTVNADHVAIAIPYWYSGDQAKRVFRQLAGYLQVIRATAGYFAYDPQTERAFDPAEQKAFDRSEYERVVAAEEDDEEDVDGDRRGRKQPRWDLL